MNLSFKLPPAGIVGVIGPNGAGKTTLFKMLTGQEKPDSGSVRVGDTVMGYVDQSRDSLDPEQDRMAGNFRRLDMICPSASAKCPAAPMSARSTSRAGISRRRSAMLSGGERNRVHLAKMLKSGANVMFLDEPTNDLDVDTLRALEEALANFPGCVVITSHDRWFLDRLATHILAFEGDSHVEWFEGNFEAYEEDKKRRLGIDSVTPHRLKFRKIA
jgi:sulfate-transporting ATPase